MQITSCFHRCTKLHSTSNAGGPSSRQCWSCHGNRGPAQNQQQLLTTSYSCFSCCRLGRTVCRVLADLQPARLVVPWQLLACTTQTAATAKAEQVYQVSATVSVRLRVYSVSQLTCTSA